MSQDSAPTVKTKVGKQPIVLRHQYGKVIDFHKHSETLVGGGGREYVNITSRTETKMDFHILTDEGLELDVQLNDDNFPLRNGQKVSIIQAFVDENTYYDAAVYVHNTERLHLISHRNQLYKNYTWWHYPLVPAVILTIRYGFESTNWLFSICFGIPLCAIMIAKITRPLSKSAIRKLDKDIKNYTDTLFQYHWKDQQQDHSQLISESESSQN